MKISVSAMIFLVLMKANRNLWRTNKVLLMGDEKKVGIEFSLSEARQGSLRNNSKLCSLFKDFNNSNEQHRPRPSKGFCRDILLIFIGIAKWKVKGEKTSNKHWNDNEIDARGEREEEKNVSQMKI